MKYLSFLLLIAASSSAYSGWIDPAEVEKITVGSNGIHGAGITLKNADFGPGCNVSTAGIIEGLNPNYEAFMSLLLAARVSGLQVRIHTAGCSGNYPKITEVQL